MSEFVRTLNRIKTHRGVEWLTPSQVRALTELREVLPASGTVNLCGPAGVGKTFLAWVLADKIGYAYFPHRSYFSEAEDVRAPGVIIDNADPGRLSHRSLLKDLEFENVKHAVLITRRLIQDYTHYVELSLAKEDWHVVADNLASIGCFVPESSFDNLWHLVNPTLRRT